MEDVVRKLKGMIGGITEVLIAAVGLLVVVQVVFGSAMYNVVGNITDLLNQFIGSGASLASVIALMIVIGILSRD
ncbi:MAG: hypothetical protein AB3N33_10200 [Puniceicoccaceae bacterium]